MYRHCLRDFFRRLTLAALPLAGVGCATDVVGATDGGAPIDQAVVADHDKWTTVGIQTTSIRGRRIRGFTSVAGLYTPPAFQLAASKDLIRLEHEEDSKR